MRGIALEPYHVLDTPDAVLKEHCRLAVAETNHEATRSLRKASDYFLQGIGLFLVILVVGGHKELKHVVDGHRDALCVDPDKGLLTVRIIAQKFGYQLVERLLKLAWSGRGSSYLAQLRT